MSISIELDDDDALVLYEWVTRSDDTSLPVVHPSERVALWALECALEKVLTIPLRPDYSNLLARARERVITKGGRPK